MKFKFGNMFLNGDLLKIQDFPYVFQKIISILYALMDFNPMFFSKDDFSVLKNTLQQCIPFIRFYNFTSKEFLDNVFPYRKILPKELLEDLLKYFLDYDDKELK